MRKTTAKKDTLEKAKDQSSIVSPITVAIPDIHLLPQKRQFEIDEVNGTLFTESRAVFVKNEGKKAYLVKIVNCLHIALYIAVCALNQFIFTIFKSNIYSSSFSHILFF